MAHGNGRCKHERDATFLGDRRAPHHISSLAPHARNLVERHHEHRVCARKEVQALDAHDRLQVHRHDDLTRGRAQPDTVLAVDCSDERVRCDVDSGGAVCSLINRGKLQENIILGCIPRGRRDLCWDCGRHSGHMRRAAPSIHVMREHS
eukprot:2964700-Prymnesium_polylepis.1